MRPLAGSRTPCTARSRTRFHGRVVLYELTDTGLAYVARGREAMTATNTRVTSGLAEEELATLTGLLRRITTRIDEPDAPLTSAWPVHTS